MASPSRWFELFSVFALASVAACGGSGESAIQASAADPAPQSERAQAEGAGSSSGTLPEPCELISAESVATALSVAASELTTKPGYNSERGSKNTRDCDWRADGAEYPVAVSYYIRKAGGAAQPDAMVQVFETTAAEGETVNQSEKASTSPIDLPGVDKALITDEHRAKYTNVRGLIWLDASQRLNKLFVTLTADSDGNAPPEVASEVLVALYNASR